MSRHTEQIRDIRGNYIYEGDVVVAMVRGEWYKGIVEYVDDCFCIRITDINGPQYDIGQTVPLFNFSRLEIVNQ